jgi:hypothetical protein
VLITSVVAAQESPEPETAQPETESAGEQPFLVSCEHPVLNKARQEGLAALSWKESPIFIVMSVRCKLQARQTKTEVPMGHLFKDKQVKRHAEAKTLSGLGSCCITVTGLILVYSFLGAALGGTK